MDMYLNISPARKRFKRILGQANHLIITALVGLEALKTHQIEQAPEELRAAWNPRDIESSVVRARMLVLEMALARAVDAIDAYFTWLRRDPSLFQDAEFEKNFDGLKKGVLNKMRLVLGHVDSVEPLLIAMAELLIAWRNNTVHLLADNEIDHSIYEMLRAGEVQLAERFCGISASQLLENYRANKAPSLKEATSLIRSAHLLVEQVEKKLFSSVDPNLFFKKLIWVDLGGRAGEGQVVQSRRMQRIQSLWGRDQTSRVNAFNSYLQNLGFSSVQRSPWALCFKEADIQVLSSLTPTGALQKLQEI